MSSPSSTTSPPARRILNEGSPNRSSSPTSAASGHGLVRTPSVRQSRPSRKSLNKTSSSFTSPKSGATEEMDSGNSNAQLLADLKEQVQRAELASEQYRKQLEMMQKRLDDNANDQTAAEERDFQRQTELDQLRAEVRESTRQRREMELSHESETRMLLQEREQQLTKESEYQAIISRLNETLRTKNLERSSANRTGSMSQPRSPPVNQDGDPFSGKNSHSSDEQLRIIREKDNVIEALRFEIADFHLKAAEEEHMGGDRLRVFAKEILDLKMQNARLVEENESFQMLLSDRTLKGDFMPENHIAEESGLSNLSTLAEELESVNDEADVSNDNYKKLEHETKTLKESNKALTLYIDKIIGRLLQHDGFEHIILDKDAPPDPPRRPMPAPARPEKALPPTPGSPAQTYTITNSTGPPVPPKAGLLDRARSVVSKPSLRARPMSYAPPASTKGHDNPETAPSIPLNRGHRRAQSDQAQQDMSGAAAVVQQMNRGSPLRSVSGGTMSPGISPSRLSYFPAAPPLAHSNTNSTRPPSGSVQSGGRDSSRNSVGSEASGEQDSNDSGSAQIGANASAVNQTSTTNAVTKQNQLRPLRLVEQTLEDDEARKKSNRGSWMGWLKGAVVETQNDERT